MSYRSLSGLAIGTSGRGGEHGAASDEDGNGGSRTSTTGVLREGGSSEEDELSGEEKGNCRRSPSFSALSPSRLASGP